MFSPREIDTLSKVCIKLWIKCGSRSVTRSRVTSEKHRELETTFEQWRLSARVGGWWGRGEAGLRVSTPEGELRSSRYARLSPTLPPHLPTGDTPNLGYLGRADLRPSLDSYLPLPCPPITATLRPQGFAATRRCSHARAPALGLGSRRQGQPLSPAPHPPPGSRWRFLALCLRPPPNPRPRRRPAAAGSRSLPPSCCRRAEYRSESLGCDPGRTAVSERGTSEVGSPGLSAPHSAGRKQGMLPGMRAGACPQATTRTLP